MFKKLLLASAILASTSSIAFAAAPYAGAGLGVTTNTVDKNNVGSFRGVPVNVFVGFGGVLTETFYLAGELNGTLATGVISDNGQLKTSYGYGASIIPGLMLSDHTLAFARVGVVSTRFTSQDENKTGGQVGVGMQTSLTQHLDIRGEYDYTAYSSVDNLDNGTGTLVSGKPVSDAFNLSLVYKFD